MRAAGRRPGFRRYIEREPLGVVLVIAPWNYPYLTAVNTIVPALIAGNAVILKHAAQTLLVGERFAAAFEKAGLPAGVFQNLVLTHAATERLIGSGQGRPRQLHRLGRGGPADRSARRRAPSPSLGLELGGKDPAYVRADAKLDHAIENLVDGAFYNSGQCCCGIERIYVHEQVYDDFVDGLRRADQEVCRSAIRSTRRRPSARWRSRSFADVVREQIAEALAQGRDGR